MKKIYYIHPENKRGLIFVTQRRMISRSPTLRVAFMVDVPGAWHEDKWNLHVDGCDYPCDSLIDALRKGADFYDYDPMTGDKPGYELRAVGKPFSWEDENPASYNLDKYTEL